MVNGFRYYGALESVSIASALSTALTHARSESINADSLNSNFLQLGRRSGGRQQRTVYPNAVTCQHCDTHYFSTPRTGNLPIVGHALPVQRSVFTPVVLVGL